MPIDSMEIIFESYVVFIGVCEEAIQISIK